MRRAVALLLAAAAAPMLSACVVAALPLAAAGVMARNEVRRGSADNSAAGEPSVQLLPGEPSTEPVSVPLAMPVAPPQVLPIAASEPTALAAPMPQPTVDPAAATAALLPIDPLAPPPPGVPTGPSANRLAAEIGATVVSVDRRQADAALAAVRRDLPTYVASAEHPYAEFIGFTLTQSDQREAGELTDTVMLAAPPLPGDERFLPCGFRPPAVLIDLDDGNGIGFNLATATADTPVLAADGLALGLEQLRLRDIAVIWLSAQPFDRIDTIAALLRSSGLDPQGRDQIVLTRTISERKQQRRSDTAASHCILAIAGDRKADFDEFYDYLRNPDAPLAIDRMVGQGWFLTPPPLALVAPAALPPAP